MSLSNEIHHLAPEIKKTLGEWPSFAGESRRLSITVPGGRFDCELSALDRMACSFSDFAWSGVALAGAGLERLKLVAERLARRITYLLEPIAVIEADPLVGVVQLRSSPPERDARGAAYYELLVGREGALHLCRFRRPPGGPRALAPAEVTREVFLRLANDFESATSAESLSEPAIARRLQAPDLETLFGR